MFSDGVTIRALKSLTGDRHSNSQVFTNTVGNPADHPETIFASRLVHYGLDIRTAAYLVGHATI
jgi:hypothetical protein